MEPLPPVKEVEYRCIVGRTFDELSGMEYVTFAFETAKEFSSFRYEIAVRYKVTPGMLEFRVLGMTATRTMMPAFGTARSVLKIPALPPGIYTILLIKSDGTENQFTIEIAKKGFQILPPVPDKRFIDFVIEKSAILAGAKMASTVSTEPPAPLIPRTIQKRQPTPPTPEEQAILDSLKTETAEERDAREEMELFGQSKRVAKSDLKESEKELEELDKGKPAATAKASKPAADDDIEELEDVPVKPAKKAGKPLADDMDDLDDEPAKPAKKPAPVAKPAPKTAEKPIAEKAPEKPVAKAPEKPVSKVEEKALAKATEKPAAKAPAKPAAKAPEKPAAKAKTTNVKTSASKTPAKPAPKNAAKAAPAKKAAPKAVSAKTGSAKTSKTTPAKKNAGKKK